MSVTAVVFAYHDVGARCLSVLLDGGVDVRLVVTHGDDPLETRWFANVADLARSRGLAVDAPADPNDARFVERLRALSPDFLFSFYYRQMLSKAVLATARRGAFNMHGSLLPKYRGRAPVNWAVLHGERETGATLHEMVEKPDAGRIAGQEAVAIGENDTAAVVMGRVTEAAGRVLEKALPGLVDGTLALKAQDLAAGSYFGGRRPEDGRIDWTRDAWAVHNLVRAVAPPYPGAFATLEGRPVRVLGSHWSEAPGGLPATAPAGAALGIDDRLYVRCGDGRWLELTFVIAALGDARALARCFAAQGGRMGQFSP